MFFDVLNGYVTNPDTNNSLTPWPHSEVTEAQMRVIAGDKGSDALADLEPKPDDSYIVTYRWSAFFQTDLDLALRTRASIQYLFPAVP